MRKADKFLIGITVGAVILVVLALIVVLNRPEETYRSEDTPEGVVYNYLLALRGEDYDRAAGYLAECVSQRPASGDELRRQVSLEKWYFDPYQQDSALDIQDAELIGNRATVQVVQRTFYNDGLFNSREISDEFSLTLALTPDGWRLVNGTRYWLPERWKPVNCP